MKTRHLHALFLAAWAVTAPGVHAAAPVPFTWSTVVNNNDLIPPLGQRNFNSYNQPSVNTAGVVVIRARSRGGPPLGQPTHGIYTRDMSRDDSLLISILDRTTAVPQPNNLGSTFVETPSFPRIDMWSDTIATRGNHQPVWRYLLDDGSETRGGTTGIYTNPFGPLITGAGKLGDVPVFSFLGVPEFSGIRFEVFPGAPAVTAGHTIVFKGNYTVGDIGKTGVYYRDLEARPLALPDGSQLRPAGGDSPVVMIANNTDTVIPGSTVVFGSTSPPSAAEGQVVFAGFDDEDNPTLGGLYLAPLQPQAGLVPLVSIGTRVPGESGSDTFNSIGEGVAFDGRFVGFWGAWGTERRRVRLYCPTEGNVDRIAYCNQQLVCEDGVTVAADENSTCDGTGCYQDMQVPLHQGIFVHDTRTGQTRAVARTGVQFSEFLFWNYSGRVPCSGRGGESAEDDGEPARWRSSAFVAVSGLVNASLRDANVHIAFKARQGNLVDGIFVDPVDGIYLRKLPGHSGIVTVIETGMEGTVLDPEAVDASGASLPVTEVGIEREGLRGNWLVINASMGIEDASEEAGMAGVYLTRLPRR